MYVILWSYSGKIWHLDSTNIYDTQNEAESKLSECIQNDNLENPTEAQLQFKLGKIELI